MRDIPHVSVTILQMDNPPGGIGEAGVPPVAPAISNAFRTLTGQRLRHLPMSNERENRASKRKYTKRPPAEWASAILLSLRRRNRLRQRGLCEEASGCFPRDGQFVVAVPATTTSHRSR
jgi:hypothetical protein